MSSILPINTLRSEFKFSDIHKKAIREKVEPRYSYWRKIRGDGNCYYRAVYVHYIEYLIFKGP